ncbi:hypothetical protein HK101_004887 [Irineochytrium annulatum]|nr:hypothetical protein HK101_004887 [Irineochytrium annulatum]
MSAARKQKAKKDPEEAAKREAVREARVERALKTATQASAERDPRSIEEPEDEAQSVTDPSVPLTEVEMARSSLRLALRSSDASVARDNYKYLAAKSSQHLLSYLDFVDYIRLIYYAMPKKPTDVDVAHMRDVLADMLQAAPERPAPREADNDEAPVPEEIYRMFLDVFARVEDMAQFAAVWDQMRMDGISASVETYNLVLGVYSKIPDPRETANVFKELLIREAEHKDLVRETKVGTSASPRDYNELEDGLEEQEEEDHAEADAVAQSGPNDTSYLHLINAYAAVGDLRTAMKVLDSLKTPSNPVRPSLAIYNALIHAHAKAKDFEKALSLFETMQMEGFRPNLFTYNMLIDGYAQAGDRDGAHSILRAMQTDPYAVPTIVTLNTLCTLHAKLGEVEEAEALLLFMDGRTDHLGRPVRPDEYTLASIMNAYKVRGDVDGARKAMARFKTEFGVRPHAVAYNILITILGGKEDLKGIRAVYDEMIKDGIKPSRVLFRIVIRVCERMVDVEAAEEWLKELGNWKTITPMVEMWESAISLHLKAARMARLARQGETPATGGEGGVKEGGGASQSYVAANVPRYPEGPILPRVAGYIEKAKAHRLRSTNLSNLIMAVDLADRPNELAKVVSSVYAAEFKKAGVKPDLETLRIILSVRGCSGEKEISKKEKRAEADALLMVYEDMAKSGTQLNEGLQRSFSTRIQALMEERPRGI